MFSFRLTYCESISGKEIDLLFCTYWSYLIRYISFKAVQINFTVRVLFKLMKYLSIMMLNRLNLGTIQRNIYL